MHVQMAFAFALHMRTSTLHIAMCVARSKSSIEGCTLYIAVQSFRNIIRNISLADTFKKVCFRNIIIIRVTRYTLFFIFMDLATSDVSGAHSSPPVYLEARGGGYWLEK